MKKGRQSDNVVVAPPASLVQLPNGDAAWEPPRYEAERSRQSDTYRSKESEKRGRSMGFGGQLDVIEKMGTPTSDGVKKDRIKK